MATVKIFGVVGLGFSTWKFFLYFSSFQFLHRESLVTKPTKHSVTIPFNEKALSWVEDVVSILHYPDDQEVVVTFSIHARCPRPYLMGRLSGPALVLLEDWTFHNQTGVRYHPATNKSIQSTMTAKYNVPFAGVYFLEILALYCQDYSYHLRHTSTDGNLQLSQSYMGSCVDPPITSRITPVEATLQIHYTNVLPQNDNLKFNGYWVHKDATPSMSTMNSTTLEPVSTRWQPRECWRRTQTPRFTDAECEAITSTARFNNYSFKWRKPDLATLLSQHPEASFCMVGASHSRGLTNSGNKVFKNTNITFSHINLRYPTDVSEASVLSASKNLTHNCTHYIIAVGQWPASQQAPVPYSFATWEEESRQMILRFQNITSNFYLRSIHYNPLGDSIAVCPPKNWRNPMVLDGYNAILKDLSLEMEVKFLDTRWMDAAVWDTAQDWYHLTAELNDLQILHLVAVILGFH